MPGNIKRKVGAGLGGFRGDMLSLSQGENYTRKVTKGKVGWEALTTIGALDNGKKLPKKKEKPSIKDYVDVAHIMLQLAVPGALIKDRPKELLEPLLPVWEDRNISNNGTKLNP